MQKGCTENTAIHSQPR